MRFIAIALWTFLSIATANAQGSAKLSNLTHLLTPIEVGNMVGISITGATPNAAVTVVQNGGAPFYMGQTDASGNWSVTATETASDVGSYSQRWYVDGVELGYNNPSTYLLHAPALPFFSVYSNFTGTNCSPGQLAAPSQCGTGNSVYHWVWSPVTYASSSSAVSSSAVVSDAQSWTNSAQGRISFSSDTRYRLDVAIFDDNGLDAYGQTFFWGEDCNTNCYNKVEECTGACLNSAAVYYVDIHINPSRLAVLALAYTSSGVSTDTAYLAQLGVEHELGHAILISHSSAYTAVCSEVQDIMYPEPDIAWLCGLSTTNSCDTSAIYTVYPNAVGFCPSYVTPYCAGVSC
jgi:hypothetical protein